MENDINHILATKRAWRTSERRGQDRRVKDGSYEDRKNAAMAIKEGRKQQQKITWWRRLLNSFSFIFLFVILCPIVHAQTIDMDKIADIESSGEALAHTPDGQHIGLYQLSQGIVTDFNHELDECGPDCWNIQQFQLEQMYIPEYALRVANWYINIKTPERLLEYGIPDTTTSRLIAFNWGIGHLRKWFNRGCHWYQLPLETRKYIRKYFNDKN